MKYLIMAIILFGCVPTKVIIPSENKMEVSFETDADNVTLQHLNGNEWISDTTIHNNSGSFFFYKKANLYRLKGEKDQDVSYSQNIFIP